MFTKPGHGVHDSIMRQTTMATMGEQNVYLDGLAVFPDLDL